MNPAVICVVLSAIVIGLIEEVFRWRQKFFGARKEFADRLEVCKKLKPGQGREHGNRAR